MRIANVFSKLGTVKDLVRPLFKKHASERPSTVNILTLVKTIWEHFYHLISSIWEELIWKISPLLICEILRVFVTTSTADDKYPVRDYESLPLPIQMQ